MNLNINEETIRRILNSKIALVVSASTITVIIGTVLIANTYDINNTQDIDNKSTTISDTFITTDAETSFTTTSSSVITSNSSCFDSANNYSLMPLYCDENNIPVKVKIK